MLLRRQLQSVATALALLAQPVPSLRAAMETPPVTGVALTGLEGVDAVMLDLMKQYDCPGAQLAVARHGRLVLAHGYGFADRDRHAPVQPESRFRIASLSKLVTAAAILMLVEQGKLDLEAKALALLPHLTALPGATCDPRLATITVRQLLQHTGGWDRSVSGDPMFMSLAIAKATETPPPASSAAVIRYMLGRPLDFEPGMKYAYYGFGINVRPIRGATGLGANWWHAGSLTGTITYQVRLASGWTWAAFFNSRPSDSRAMSAALDKSINATLAASSPPAEGDLFPKSKPTP